MPEPRRKESPSRSSFPCVHALFQISVWDALVVAAAEAAGCDMILSEDLNPDQTYGSIRVQNPFEGWT